MLSLISEVGSSYGYMVSHFKTLDNFRRFTVHLFSAIWQLTCVAQGNLSEQKGREGELKLQFVQGEFASVQISKKVLQGGFHGHKGNVIPRNVIFAE